ncbi:MAG TPA: class I SAM-dependent methyltransferase [Flavobacteriales bacterium]|nr:class I SAM-dependent methyltransferase [Flavobacteriales bacterium]
MDKELQKDILQWDVQSWSRPLRYWEQAVDWSKIENVLELGSNLGGLSLWLALKNKKVICSDRVDSQKKAEHLHTKYGLNGNVVYRDIDATSIPFENHFDLIVFKSVVTVIGRDGDRDIQIRVFDQVYKALKPGGTVLFAENLKASRLHQWSRKKFIEWGGSARYLALEDMSLFLEKFSSRKIYTTGVLATFGRSEKQRKVLAGIDSVFLNRLCPSRWNYIVYGSAVK